MQYAIRVEELYTDFTNPLKRNTTMNNTVALNEIILLSVPVIEFADK